MELFDMNTGSIGLLVMAHNLETGLHEMHTDKVGMGSMLYEVHAVLHANDHPAFNEPCDTILSCILAINL